MKILAHRNSVQGLLMYYVSLYGFVGSCISLTQGISTWKLVGILLTLFATLLQDINWFRRSRVHPHDMQLIDKLTALLQETKSDVFLKNHDFTKHTYDDTNLEPLLTIDENWQGVDFEFVHPGNQLQWGELKLKLNKLMIILTEGYSMKGMNFYHLLPSPKDRDTDPDINTKMETAKAANDLARAIFEDFQVFRRIHHKNSRILDKI